MKCQACGAESPADAIFCGQCGSSLAAKDIDCPNCGRQNPQGTRFCHGCGAALTSTSPTPASSSPSPTTTPAISHSHPTSFVHGRYVVIRFLGEGGKKKVYLAHDIMLDRDVAFALIKMEGLDATARARILREAQAMGRLGDHPNIVTVYEIGEENGQPYIISQFMAGGDVEALIEKAQDHKLPVERSLKIVREVCSGLEHAHSKVIIHRDLKPGNVWLTADGVTKIGDFGLSVAMDRSRLTQTGMMIGTVSYMPPEQAMGGEPVFGSDLYSLGAMLYEMVTGRPPFVGDDNIGIISQHINTPPVAPSWHNSLCSRPLEALIMRLLAKNPTQRPESASDVLKALESLDLTTSVEQPVREDSQALDSLAGGVFVGRGREMGELRAALEESLSGRGRLVTLVGEPGIGKTRTAQELATYATLRGAQVLWGRCYEAQGVPPYWPWVQAIRSYVREREPDALRSEMGSGAADIAEIVSEVRERLPGLQPPPQEEPDAARFRLFDAIATFLRSASKTQPLVIILDDLHWADKPSLALLEFVAKELAGARLLLVGTYRDVELSRQHPLAQTLGELARERLFQRVLLRGLSLDDVRRFIEVAAGITPPSGLAQAIHTQTEGNPFFVSEVVRLLVQEGELTRASGGARGPGSAETWTLRIPEGVKEVVGRRLDHLSERCNQTLTVAAVIGREFDLRQLLSIADDPSAGPEGRLSEDRLLELVEEAQAARVIEELPRSVGRYQFSHALIQQTLAEELSTTRRVRLHARIAEALESLYGPEADAHAAELAHHYAEAEAVLGNQKLVYYSLIAGERAIAAYAWEEALAHFQRALAARDGGPEDTEAAALLFGMAKAQGALASERPQMEEAFANLVRAFDCYAGIGDISHALAVAAYRLILPNNRIPGNTEFLGRALELAPADSHEAGRILALYGAFLGVAEGDYDAAENALSRALAIAQREKDVALEADTMQRFSAINGEHLKIEESLKSGERAIDLAGSSRVVGSSWVWASLIALGRLEEARRNAVLNLTVVERTRNRGAISTAFRNMVTVCHLAGEWKAAREHNDRGLEARATHPLLLALRAMIESQLGEFEAGESYLERLLELMRVTQPGAINEYVSPAIAIPIIARVTGDTGRFALARVAAEVVLSNRHTPYDALIVRVGLSLMAVQIGDIPESEGLYTLILPQRGTMLTDGYICSDRILGLLSNTVGRGEDAVAHFEDAAAFCSRAGYRPELAWTYLDYADTLLKRDGPGDHAKAMSLLDESLKISQELGMRPLMEQVLSRREFLKA